MSLNIWSKSPGGRRGRRGRREEREEGGKGGEREARDEGGKGGEGEREEEKNGRRREREKTKISTQVKNQSIQKGLAEQGQSSQ